MPERKPIVSANWKMNKTIEETERFLAGFLPSAERIEAVEITVCPPYLALKHAVELCAQSRVGVMAQNMHEAESGAFTGEVSAAMLTELGLDGVVLGHSERRQYFNETDEALAAKLPVALGAGLTPILCVGESQAEREAGETEAVLERQITADLAAVGDERLADVVIAYEPIWAIGTGLTATDDQADEACGYIRSLVAARSEEAAASIRIQYGGSVKPGNAAGLLGREHIDGALVGGASLEPDSFAAICEAAAR